MERRYSGTEINPIRGPSLFNGGVSVPAPAARPPANVCPRGGAAFAETAGGAWGGVVFYWTMGLAGFRLNL